MHIGSLAAALLLALAVVPAFASEGATEAERSAFRRPDTIPFPKDNPYTPEKAALGKMLFFDTRLSRDKNLNCASCHNPSFGWQVPFARAIGAGGQPLGRHSPTTLNQAWGTHFFWDGRAPSLEAQARGPIEASAEMDLPMGVLTERLAQLEGYRQAFAKAFPKKDAKELIGAETVAQAIATYERTIVSGDTPFDRWLRGDTQAMNESARRGFALFTGKARCATCHSGWNFTDGKFHDIGLPTTDPGRMGVTKEPADAHAFKTSSLREIAARAPYMHLGQLPNLEAVVAHYLSGGEARPSRSPEMRPLPLSPQDMQDLVAFMRSLSSARTVVALPALPAQ